MPSVGAFSRAAQTRADGAQQTLVKKREELARVLEWLRSPQLSHGMARELRKHVAILEREIAELEREGLDRP